MTGENGLALDLETLARLTAIVGVELALFFLLLAWVLRGQPGIGPWASGMCALALAALGLPFRHELPALLPAGAGLLCLATALTWLGARDYCGRARGRSALLAFLVGCAPFLFVGAAGWLAPTSVALSLGLLATAWTFARHPPWPQRWLARGTALYFLGVAVLVPLFCWPLEDAGIAGPPARVKAGFIASMLFAIVWALLVLVLTSHRLLDDLRRAARTDALTGMLNRSALAEEGARVVEACREAGEPCAVLLADLDHFKRLNDTYGHPAGDAALVHFAALATSLLRPEDLLGRYGGEEFCVILPGAPAAYARRTAEALRSALGQNPAPVGGHAIPLTTSIGLAWDPASTSLKALLTRADKALYQAKANGRDQVQEAPLTGSERAA